MSFFEQIKQGSGGSGTGISFSDSWYVTLTDGTQAIGVSGHPVVVSMSGTVDVSDRAGRQLGLVYQGTSPWVTNISQFGGNAVVTGTGASGSGIPRVTVANDSKIQLWDGTHTAAVTAGGSQSISLDEVGGVATTLGQKTMANSIPVAIASDQDLTVTVGAVFTETTGVVNSGTQGQSIGSSNLIINNQFKYTTLIIVFDATGVLGTGGVIEIQGSTDNGNFIAMPFEVLTNDITFETTQLTTDEINASPYNVGGGGLVAVRLNTTGFPYVRIYTTTGWTGAPSLGYEVSQSTGINNFSTASTIVSPVTALGTSATKAVNTILLDQAGNTINTLPWQYQYTSTNVFRPILVQAAPYGASSFTKTLTVGNAVISIIVAAKGSGLSGYANELYDSAGNLYTKVNGYVGGNGTYIVYYGVITQEHDLLPTGLPGTMNFEYQNLGVLQAAGIQFYTSTTSSTSGSQQDVVGPSITAGPAEFIGFVNAQYPHSTITNVSINGSNVATLTGSGMTFSSGQTVHLSNFTNATFLNGQTVTLTGATSTTLTFNFTHASYSTGDTGWATTYGGSVPLTLASAIDSYSSLTPIRQQFNPDAYTAIAVADCYLPSSNTEAISWYSVTSANVFVADTILMAYKPALKGQTMLGLSSDGTVEPLSVDASSGGLKAYVTNLASTLSVAGTKTSNSTAANNECLQTLPAVATTSAPTYVSGRSVALSTDLSGNVRMVGSGTTYSSGVPTGTTYPIQVDSQGRLVLPVTSVTVQNTSIPVTQSGAWSISATNPSVSGTAAAVPASATYLGGNKSGNLVGLTLDSSSNLNVVVNNTVPVSGSVSVSGTIAATQSGTWNVGTLTSITNAVTVAQPTAANLNATVVFPSAQPVSVSSLPAVVGNLTNNNAVPVANNIGVLPAVVAPTGTTYTTGDQVLLTTDGTGALRVIGASGQQYSDATPVGTPTGVVNMGYDGASVYALRLDASKNLKVAQQGTVTVTGSVSVSNFPSNQTVNLSQFGGTPVSLGQGFMSASLPVCIASDQSSIPVTVSGTVSTTFSDPAEGSTSAAVPSKAIYIGGNQSGNLVGLSLNGSGQLNVAVNGSVGQGSPATVANAWPIKITDGTNTATIAALTNSKAQHVAIVDASGNQITSFGGGTQYAQSTSNSTPTGTVAMGLNPSNLLKAISLDANSAQYVNILASSTLNVAQSGAWNVGQTGTWNFNLPTGASTNAGAANGASGQVSIATTATSIVSARATRRSIKITNLGTTDVYIGFSSGVTTSTGDLLLGSKGSFVSFPTSSAVYAIVASGTQSISYSEVYD
ncbi:MAG TPA: hypothetical protein VN577_10130 [Terriglobales bacterium]|nr:hypothetical protein [Terriglobales bacterium]